MGLNFTFLVNSNFEKDIPTKRQYSEMGLFPVTSSWLKLTYLEPHSHIWEMKSTNLQFYLHSSKFSLSSVVQLAYIVRKLGLPVFVLNLLHLDGHFPEIHPLFHPVLCSPDRAAMLTH